MDNLERRSFAECRAESEDGKRIVGHAIVFDSLSVDLGGFQEIIAAEAVDRTLNEGTDVRALVDHDSSKIIGRTRAGTLLLKKDRKGLRAIIEPDLDITYARDIMRAVQRGDVSGMSFRFKVLSDEWDLDRKVPVRTITDMHVAEVSIVTFPAYPATDVDVALRALQSVQPKYSGNRIEWLKRWQKTRLAR